MKTTKKSIATFTAVVALLVTTGITTAAAQIVVEKSFQRYQWHSPQYTCQDFNKDIENIYLNASGSRYLIENWTPAKLTTTSGDEYSNITAKYDVLNNKVEVIARNKELAPNNVSKLVLYISSDNSLTFQNGFPKVASNDSKTLYQVLTNGKASLLKKPVKKLQIENIYNSGIKATQFNTTADYYVYKDSRMVKIDKTRSAIAAVLADKQEQVLAYIDENKLKLKNDNELEMVVKYYNML
jgi:hypothetical protein